MSDIKFTGKPLSGLQKDFLNAFLSAATGAGARAIDVFSAYRSPAYNAQVGGAQNSNHMRGDAIDARVLLANGWIPAGDLPGLSQYGLRSGDQPGFFHGQPDPNHVDFGLPGGGQSAAPAGLPGSLSSVISKAASAYHVPADVLAGIWKIETGGKYPNPYVNSSGYGGLFGTHNWNASEQDQANTAASILSRLLQEKGSLPAALSAYSGGGYTSVPGMSASAAPGGSSAPAAPAAPAARNISPLLALLASQPQPQPFDDLPEWSHVPEPGPNLLPLLLASQ